MSLELKEENDIKNTSVNDEESGDNLDGQQEPINDTFWGCKNCGSLEVEEGYNLRLCKKCRDKLSKRPIPIQIKLASGLLILIMIFSFSKFSRTIRVGIEYERGLRAEKAGQYVTAISNYENVIKEYPDSDKVLVRLYVSYYENEQIDEAYDVFDKIAGDSPSSKKIDKNLVAEVNETTRKLDKYYNPGKQTYDKLKNLKNAKAEEIVNVLKPIVDKDANEVYAAYYLASIYFDSKNYSEANQVLSKVMAKNPDFYAGYILQAATCRELGQYDKAIEYCNKVLEHNVEDVGAYVTLSKIELKRRNNAKGLEYARKAFEIDGQDPSVIANLALACHFNNLVSERDKYYKLYQDSNSRDKYTDDLLKSIFSGMLQWQK